MDLSGFILTFDIDWAPDFVIRDLADILIERQVKATWFATHETPVHDFLRQHGDLFELGIHPNFLPGSSHGKTSEEVLDCVMKLVPEAVSSRSHAVVQSGPILDLLVRESPIAIDTTLFLPEHPGLQPVRHLTLSGELTRVPFYWADDYEMCREPRDWTLNRHVDVPGIKVMMFHPIHVYLNTNDFTTYADLKQQVGPLNQATAQELEAFRHDGQGSRTMLLELVDHLASGSESCQLKHVLSTVPKPQR